MMSLAGEAVGQKPLFFCALARSAQERGSLYGLGLAAYGVPASSLVTVAAKREKDALWAAEEALGSASAGAVMLWLSETERLYGFTASRRLKLRAETSGCLLLTLRHWAAQGPTAVTARWRIAPATSQSGLGVPSAVPLLGPPRLRLTLERCGSGEFQAWHMKSWQKTWEMERDASGRFGVVQNVEHRPDQLAARQNAVA
jgi:protein ImuA